MEVLVSHKNFTWYINKEQMMKKMNFFCLLGLLSISTFGQTDTYLRLYANMGSQLNNLNNAFNTNLNSNFFTFQLGAGSNYKFGRFLIGSEFYNSNGSVENNQFRINHQEFISKLSVGYDLLKSSNVSLEPSIGFFMSNGQSVKYELSNQITEIYKIGQLGISPSITITSFNHSNLSTALKIGCNIPLGHQTWKNGIDDSQTIFSSNEISPFIQLNIGGRIKLKKKSSPENLI